MMTEEERAALAAVQFNWAMAPDDVWTPSPYHVEELHAGVVRTVMASVGAARRSSGASPIGVALEGEKGVGKTHLLGWVRQQVQQTDGYFFLIKVREGTPFWRSAVHGIVDGFRAGPDDQLTRLLRALARITDLPVDVTERVCGEKAVERGDLDLFISNLRRLDRQVGTDCQNTARALVLYAARDDLVQEIGYGYLELDGTVEDEARAEWGFRRGSRTPPEILSDLSSLLALTGPTVIAVDQLDVVLAQLTGGRADAPSGEGETDYRLLNEVSDGLMELREQTRRTLSVVACIPTTWALIKNKAVGTVADRFRKVKMTGEFPESEVAGELVARHLAGLYSTVGFTPPYRTWPVRPTAFSDNSARRFTPRRLLQRVDSHIRRCLESDTVIELGSFDDEPLAPDSRGHQAGSSDLSGLDRRFDELRAAADTTGPLDPKTEDHLMPNLLAAGLNCYIIELGDRGRDFELDPPPGPKPALHARLRQTLDEQTEDEAHWAFRAISAPHHRAALTRLRAARTETGIQAGVDKRKLVVIRNVQWSGGPVTKKELADFEAAGGRSLVITTEDLKTFSALDVMRRSPEPGFLEWLLARKPAGESELFRRVLGEARAPVPDHLPNATIAPPSPPAGGTAPPDPGAAVSSAGPVGRSAGQSGRTDESSPPRSAAGEPLVVVGRSVDGDQDFSVPLSMFRKHTVAFAGSGSGKTVLLRRLIEECALLGVSAIVLDPNNDLARLGDRWPTPPSGWFEGDTAKAERYLDGTDVVVWTPGVMKGRPLSFQPLPDFSGVLDDPDEFRRIRDAAVAGLVPRARLSAGKMQHGTAVLNEALTYFAEHGGVGLDGFLHLLSELPDGVSSLRKGQQLAADIAEALIAATINDPLFGGHGTALDPGVLLTPARGCRARISVISFVGLDDDTKRQGFVSQLQLALFSWIKRNPAADRPLGGLLVMDEAQTFAPSGITTPATETTLALASQARKYGLGLVFATQAPKGLHNRIPGNATTQFIGLLNSPTQISAAVELARVKGGRVDDIARLTAGVFYAASEGQRFEKIRVPMSLSHHPASPLTSEEVIARAGQSSAPGAAEAG